MSIQDATLFLATLSTGLMAGIFFTWTNAVTPGIGLLKDIEYLGALQAMNRVILNPLFYIIFMAPVLSLPLATVFNYDLDNALTSNLLFTACIIYLVGSFLVTLQGNIPLNKRLDSSDLKNFSVEQAGFLRGEIESKWNAFNLIRTLTSCISFVLLLITCLLITI